MMGMWIMLQPCPDPGALLARLDEIEAVIGSKYSVSQAKLGELRRQAKARRHRRGGQGSVDSNKYAIGGGITMLAGPVDPTRLVGLLAQTDMMLAWMVEARLAHGQLGFGELLAHVLADPRKAEWCRRWGAIVEWHHRKALYDASVTSFEQSGRTGPKEPWRRDPITDDQAELVETLCRLLGEPNPELPDKGAAYEWIKGKGGNPAYWTPPPHPNSWGDHDAG